VYPCGNVRGARSQLTLPEHTVQVQDLEAKLAEVQRGLGVPETPVLQRKRKRRALPDSEDPPDPENESPPYTDDTSIDAVPRSTRRKRTPSLQNVEALSQTLHDREWPLLGVAGKGGKGREIPTL
jgi:hypothetical protein